MLDHVELKNKEAVDEVTTKIVDEKLIKNILEKMRISGKNLWTSVQDVTTSPKEISYIDQMVSNGLLDKSENLVRFKDSRVFSIADKHIK